MNLLKKESLPGFRNFLMDFCSLQMPKNGGQFFCCFQKIRSQERRTARRGPKFCRRICISIFQKFGKIDVLGANRQPKLLFFRLIRSNGFQMSQEFQVKNCHSFLLKGSIMIFEKLLFALILRTIIKHCEKLFLYHFSFSSFQQ